MWKGLMEEGSGLQPERMRQRAPGVRGAAIRFQVEGIAPTCRYVKEAFLRRGSKGT